VVTQPPKAASSSIIPAVRFIASPFGNSQPAFSREPESNTTACARLIAENGPPKADIFALVAWGYTRPAPGANFRQNRKTLPMPLVRYTAFLLLIPSAVLLTGARNSHSPRKNSTASDPEAHATAVKYLTDALDRLSPQRVQWLEMKLWQKGRLGRYSIEADGRYLAGPDNHLRLELTTHHADASATMLAVSDGRIFYQARCIGEGPWTESVSLDLKQVLQSGGLAPVSNASDKTLDISTFTGVVPLLHILRSEITWSHTELVRRGEHRLLKLTGSVHDDNSRREPRSSRTPRRCRLYLGAADLWLHRLEWWGPGSPNEADTLLMQLEFRDPIINQPLSQEQAAREFQFPATAMPLHEPMPEALSRARQLLAPSGNGQ
jgi:hypothetical protein